MSEYVFTPAESAARERCLPIIRTLIDARGKVGGLPEARRLDGEYLRSILSRAEVADLDPWAWPSWVALLAALIDHVQDVADEAEAQALIAQQTAARLRRSIDR